MKKFIFYSLALLMFAGVSCSKSDNPADNAGKQIKISVSIDNPQSKLSYTEDAKALKGAWGASEKISVVTYDADGLVTNDIFTYDGPAGLAKVDFTGTLSSAAVTDHIVLIYPALSETVYESHVSADVYCTPIFSNNHEKNLIKAGMAGMNLIYAELPDPNQIANGDFSHITNVSFLYGSATEEAGIYTAKMTPCISIIKVNATFPDVAVGEKAKRVIVNIENASNQNYSIQIDGYMSEWLPAYTPVDDGGNKGFKMALGGWKTSDGDEANGIVVPASKTMTFYIPFLANYNKEFGPAGGAQIRISVDTYNSTDQQRVVSFTNTLTQTIPVQTGKMYSVSGTLN